MDITAESIAIALGGKKLGQNWQCVCPAHEDNKPSLSIKQGHSTILIKCRSGCESRDVIRALGDMGLWFTKKVKSNPKLLSNSDLFELWLYVDIARNMEELTEEQRTRVNNAHIALSRNNYRFEQARATLKRLSKDRGAISGFPHLHDRCKQNISLPHV